MRSVWARRQRLAASGLRAILTRDSRGPSARPTPVKELSVVPPSAQAASPVDAAWGSGATFRVYVFRF